MCAARYFRNSLIVMAIFLGSQVFAMADGFYMGLGVGKSNIDAPDTTILGVASTAKTTGIGERLYMGGQFNKHGAFEMGFTHYGPAVYDVNAPSGEKPAIRVNALDLSFRAILPIEQLGVAVFAMPGVAVASAAQSGSIDANSSSSQNFSFRPRMGLGVSYDITQRWMVDFSVQQMFGNGVARTSRLAAISFSYHIVDEMCGDFLC